MQIFFPKQSHIDHEELQFAEKLVLSESLFLDMFCIFRQKIRFERGCYVLVKKNITCSVNAVYRHFLLCNNCLQSIQRD